MLHLVHRSISTLAYYFSSPKYCCDVLSVTQLTEVVPRAPCAHKRAQNVYHLSLNLNVPLSVYSYERYHAILTMHVLLAGQFLLSTKPAKSGTSNSFLHVSLLTGGCNSEYCELQAEVCITMEHYFVSWLT